MDEQPPDEASTRFATFRACAQHLSELLRDPALDESLRQALARELTRCFAGSPSPPAHAFGLIVGDYVIRNDDLSIFAGLKAALVAAAPASFFLSQPTTAAIVGSVAAVVTVARSALKKGVRLQPIALSILLCLKGSPTRLTVAELAARLNTTRSEAGTLGAWTPKQVEAELDLLGKIAVRDGSVIALVARDSDARWGAVDV